VFVFVVQGELVVERKVGLALVVFEVFAELGVI
jgi:hypothetical protein